MSRTARLALVLGGLALSIPSLSAPALAAGGSVKFAKPASWSDTIWGDMRVASRARVEKAIGAEARARFGAHAKIDIELSKPHGYNVGIDAVARIPRVFGKVSVDGKSAGEIFVDASRGKVRVFRDRDHLLSLHGKPTINEQLTAHKAAHPEKLQPFIVQARLTAPPPAVYAFGFRTGPNTATLAHLNGQVPGFTVPQIMGANPFYNAWAQAFGFTRIK